MAQIQNSRFVAPVQEPDVQHPARPRGGAGQLRRQPEGTEPTVRHPHHSGAHGKGLGGNLPVGHDHQQLADGAVPAFQVPPPKGAGTAGHTMLRRMGGNLRQEDDGLRVQRDEQHRAEGTLPLLHQGAGTGGVLQRDNGLPHGGGRGCGQTAQERVLHHIPPTARPGTFHQATDGICQDGRRHLLGRGQLSETEEKAKMLIATDYARKMALDMRMIDPEYEDHPDNKASHCARTIAEYYRKV